MARIEVLVADEIEAVEDYSAPTCSLAAGRATSRLHDPEDNPLWTVTADLDAGARLEWGTDHGDEAVYVTTGSLRTGDRVCGVGSVLVVESGVAISAEATEPATVIHFGPPDPSVPTDGRNGAPNPSGHHT